MISSYISACNTRNLLCLHFNLVKFDLLKLLEKGKKTTFFPKLVQYRSGWLWYHGRPNSQLLGAQHFPLRPLKALTTLKEQNYIDLSAMTSN